MPINLPRIEGTAYDDALNEFIDFVNSEASPDQPKLAAHAAAAIVRFLIENHEVEAGTLWTRETMPLVEHIDIIPPMVDKLYQPLIERAKQPRKQGCAGIAMALVALPVVAGITILRTYMMD